MPTCIVKGCKNHLRKAGKLHGITYHRLPADPKRRENWSRIIRKYRNDPFFKLTSDSRVCSAHFCETDFDYSKTGIRRLKGSAEPQLLEDSDSEHSRPSTPDFSEIEEIDDGQEDFRDLIVFHSPRKIIPKKEFLEQNSVDKKFKKYNARLKKNTSLQDIIKHLKDKNYINEQIKYILSNNADIAELYRLQAIKNKNTKRPSCPPALRKFAMALNFCSPSVYKYVRQKFYCFLPHPRSLTKWYGVINGEPGFTQESFEMLKLKRDSISENIECCLFFGDMNIKEKSCKGQGNAGFVNMGHGLIDEETIATKAFVMILVCLTENWKIPVGYFLVDDFTSELIANTVNICLAKCHSVGVNVQALTFNGCSNNIRAANVLGCNINGTSELKTTFLHPVTKADIVVFLDACYMMELVRNSLQYKKIINKQDQRIESKSLSYFSGTDATVEFINMFNDVFDILNSQSAISHKNKEEILNLIQKAVDYIKDLKIIIKVKRTIKKPNRKPRTILISSKKPILVSKIKTGFLGLIVCLEGLKVLYQNLVETGKLEYISTYRLGDQDHLKLFFNLIRQHVGDSENPTATQLKDAYRQYIDAMCVPSFI